MTTAETLIEENESPEHAAQGVAADLQELAEEQEALEELNSAITGVTRTTVLTTPSVDGLRDVYAETMREEVNYPKEFPVAMVTLYEIDTGTPSLMLTYIAKNCLLKDRGPKGEKIWTADPSKAAKLTHGSIKCYFHPDSAHAGEVDRAGLGHIRCGNGKRAPKSNLRTEIDLEGHMRSAHGKEYTLLERSRERLIEGEEREFRRLQMRALRNQVGEEAPDLADEEEGIFRCEADECGRFYDNENALKIHVGKEHKD